MVINIILFWILVVFGSIVSLYNWIIFFKSFVIKSEKSSCIPLLGGGAIYLAMNLSGIDMEEYESIPLLLDYGCIPLFCSHVFFLMYKLAKGLFK